MAIRRVGGGPSHLGGLGWRVVGVSASPARAAGLEATTGIDTVDLAAFCRSDRGWLTTAGRPAGTVIIADGVDAWRLDQLEAVLDPSVATRVVLVSARNGRGPSEGVLEGLGRDRQPVVQALPARHRRAGDRSPGPEVAGPQVAGPQVAGRGSAAAVAVDAAGPVVVGSTAATTRSALVEDWWKAHEAGHRAVMVAPDRSEAALLNQAARQRLARAGALGPTAPAHLDLAVGDRALLRWGRPGWALEAGSEVTVVGVDPGGDRITLQAGEGHKVSVPAASLRAGQLTPAYALTTGEAVRVRADRELVLGAPAAHLGLPEAEMHPAPGTWHRVHYVVGRDEPIHTLDTSPLHARLLALAGPREPGEEAHAPRRSLAELGTELEQLRLGLLAGAVGDPAAGLRALDEEQARVQTGLRRARESLAQATGMVEAIDHRRGWRRGQAREQAALAMAGASELVRGWERAAGRLSEDRRQAQEAMAQRSAWLDVHAKDLDRYRALAVAIEGRIAVLVRAAEVAPPAHIRSCLGPCPSRLSERGAWRQAVAAIQDLRERRGITDPDRALGPEPARTPTEDLARHLERQEVAGVLARALRHLGREPAIVREVDLDLGRGR